MQIYMMFYDKWQNRLPHQPKNPGYATGLFAQNAYRILTAHYWLRETFFLSAGDYNCRTCGRLCCFHCSYRGGRRASIALMYANSFLPIILCAEMSKHHLFLSIVICNRLCYLQNPMAGRVSMSIMEKKLVWRHTIKFVSRKKIE